MRKPNAVHTLIFLLDAMKDEVKSMTMNDVQDLVKLLEDNKLIGCKQVYKTNRDSNGQVNRYEAKVVAKRVQQRGN